MFAYGIFKVIYSPFKAFKEIIQDPKYIGPILVMILFVATNVGSIYIAISKTHVEQTLPKTSQLDEWTENGTLWTPTPKANYDDHITGVYYGNRSLEFSIIDKRQIWMELNGIEPVNCSGRKGYKNMSFRVKLICSTIKELKNASLLLYSSPADWFYYNLTKHFTPLNTTVWNNLTIPVGPESKCWLSSSQADWSHITELRFEFTWPENANATIRIDGLFFRGVFRSELENASIYILNFSLSAFMEFTIKWVILSGALYLLTKALGRKAVWKPLLIAVGFALVTSFVQAVINTAAYASLPTLYYPLEYFTGTKVEFEVAQNRILEQTWLVSQISNCAQIAVFVWTIALCAIALRLLTELSWTKSFLVSTAAYFVSMLVESFILGY